MPRCGLLHSFWSRRTLTVVIAMSGIASKPPVPGVVVHVTPKIQQGVLYCLTAKECLKHDGPLDETVSGRPSLCAGAVGGMMLVRFPAPLPDM